MSLNDLKKQALDGFDAANDSPTTAFEGLPSGTYDVALVNVDHFVSDSETPWEGVRIILKVLTGDHAEQEDRNIFDLEETTKNGKKMPAGLLQTRIRLIEQLAVVTDTPSPDYDETNYLDAIPQAFVSAIGKQFKLDLTVRENKNNPRYPNKEYKFSREDPFTNLDKAQPVDMSTIDDETPF